MAYQSFNGVRPSIRIRILVVDDDYMCLNVVATTLRSLKYEVLTAKHPFEALSTLRLMEGGIDLVVSDYHMPDMNGVQLQKKILEEFKIPVIMMSIDNREYVMVESLRGGAKIFIVKPIHVEKVENVWQYVVANNKGKSPSVEIDSVNRVGNYLEFQDPRPVSFSISCNKPKEDGKHKNHKVVWTNALHTLFLQAINQIGLEKAVPKKILDMMNVPGLTRQHVASHLQKYRIFLKKVADRGLVKWNDPQKALNNAFALTMTSNAQYRDMILSMPPSQFAKSQPKFGSSSSVISMGNNQNGANKRDIASSSHRLLNKPNHGSYGFPLTPSSTLGRDTCSTQHPCVNPSRGDFSNNMGGGIQGFGGDSRNMFHQENQAIPRPFHQSQQGGNVIYGTEIGIDSSAKYLNSAWNGNPNSSWNIQNGQRIHGNEHQFPTQLGFNSMSPNPNIRSLNNQIGNGIPANDHVFHLRVGLSSMGTNPNNSSFNSQIGLKVLENEPTRLGLNSLNPNPNNNSISNNQIGITMCGSEHLVPSCLGLSNSYKPDNGCDIRVDSAKGTLAIEKGMNLIEPKISGDCCINQGENPGFSVNILNSTPATKNVQDKGASNDIEVSPYVLDKLETTISPPPDMSEKLTLGDGGFYDLDLLELLLPQSIGDIDMALESAPPPFNYEQVITNESEDQNWDDDFIGSLLVDDGSYIDDDQSSRVLP